MSARRDASGLQAALRRTQARLDRRIDRVVAAIERQAAATAAPTVVPSKETGHDAFTVLAAAIGGAFEGLGKGLNSMVEASARQQEATGKVLEMLLMQAAKRATSEKMSALGKKGGLATQDAARAQAASRSEILSKVGQYCENCGALLEGRKPRHARDAFRHAREGHELQLPALREALNGASAG
jgi:hypothetical protein